MGVLDYKRDGYVTIARLDKVLSDMDAHMAKSLEGVLMPMADRIIALEAKVKKLDAELETERRLRLGRRK